jgi:hypothetical protein
MLGHLVHSEESEAAAETAESDPNLRQCKQDLRRGHQQSRSDMLRDVGIR